ncbi:FUSC family protein [Pendulispora brunnea]|uniref:FUSC family protein n=1 Tax=Pendulispora brunnea TaxID=2905690 RepID=A0ABZ2KH51_9BACT
MTKAHGEAMLFSAKCFVAAMLAYYVSLRISLTGSYWAIGTVYIVSQVSAGASLGRGFYRVLGTLGGAVATVAIVFTFANEPLLLSVALATWIGFCLYVSLLDSTPRAYAFALAGATASLIGFPSVIAPASIFAVASLRVQEISIGVVCAGLIHGFVFPRRATDRYHARLSHILANFSPLLRKRFRKHDGSIERAQVPGPQNPPTRVLRRENSQEGGKTGRFKRVFIWNSLRVETLKSPRLPASLFNQSFL